MEIFSKPTTLLRIEIYSINKTNVCMCVHACRKKLVSLLTFLLVVHISEDMVLPRSCTTSLGVYPHPSSWWGCHTRKQYRALRKPADVGVHPLFSLSFCIYRTVPQAGHTVSRGFWRRPGEIPLDTNDIGPSLSSACCLLKDFCKTTILESCTADRPCLSLESWNTPRKTHRNCDRMASLSPRQELDFC